jgi:hypothetical protein
MIEIERNIPTPSTKSQGLRRLEEALGADHKLPFGNMDIGHSFLIPKDKCPRWFFVNTITSLARAYGKQTGRKFKTSKTSDGIRCWRIL